MVERSPVPWTILRATQFHEFVLMQIRLLDRLPVYAHDQEASSYSL